MKSIISIFILLFTINFTFGIIIGYHPSYVVYGADDFPFNKHFVSRFVDQMRFYNNKNGVGIIIQKDGCGYGLIFRDSSLGGHDNIEPYGADTKKLVVFANHGGPFWIGNEWNYKNDGLARLGNGGDNDCNWYVDFGCSKLYMDDDEFPWWRFAKAFQGLHGIIGFYSPVIGTTWGDPYDYNNSDLEYLGKWFVTYLYQGNTYYAAFCNAAWKVFILGDYGGRGKGGMTNYVIKMINMATSQYDYANESLQVEYPDNMPQWYGIFTMTVK